VNIAFFSDDFYPNVDGVVKCTDELMTVLVKKGHECALFTWGEKNKTEKRNGYTVHYYKASSIKSYPGLRTRLLTPKGHIRGVLREFKPDVFHSQTQLFMGGVAYTMSREFKKPLIAAFHTHLLGFLKQGIESEQQPKSLPIKVLCSNKLTRELLKLGVDVLGGAWQDNYLSMVDKVTVPSEYVKEYLKKRTPNLSVEVIPNWIRYKKPPSVSKEKLKRFRKKYGLKKNDFVVLHSGRASVEKRINIVIKVARELKNEDVKFLIVGGGPALNNLKQQAKNLGVKEKIVFTGFVNDEDFNTAYAASNVFITPSLYETFNLSAAKSMNCGIPILGAKSGGLTSVIEHGVNGYLIPPTRNEVKEYAELIIKLKNSKKLMQKMKRDSQKLGENYDLDLISERILHIYETTPYTGKKRIKNLLFKTVGAINYLIPKVLGV